MSSPTFCVASHESHSSAMGPPRHVKRAITDNARRAIAMWRSVCAMRVPLHLPPRLCSCAARIGETKRSKMMRRNRTTCKHQIHASKGLLRSVHRRLSIACLPDGNLALVVLSPRMIHRRRRVRAISLHGGICLESPQGLVRSWRIVSLMLGRRGFSFHSGAAP